MDASSTVENSQPLTPRLAGQAPEDQDAQLPILQLIVRWRWAFFILLAAIQLATFNGRWRIGRDGALYRDVAQNLAAGKGYTYRDALETHVYPGLPLLLAGIEKVFGPQDPLQPTATLIVMGLIGVATLIVIYQLMKMYLPQWLAVCIVTGVGINRIFLMQEHDMMTDVPFLLASMTALLGLAHFKRSATTRGKVISGTVLAGSLILALMIRPTFWCLAAAMIGASLIGVFINSRRRWIYLVAMGAIAAVAILWFLFDPRTRGGGGILGGVYEHRAWERITHLASLGWHDRIVLYCTEHFPHALTALDLPVIGYIFTPAVFIAAILLVRRSWVWGLYVLATLGVTLIMGSVERYFLMILPMLLAGWGLMLYTAARSISRTRYAWAAQLIIAVGLVIATVPNLIRTAGFAMEQHGIGKDFKPHPFLEVYRGGKMKPIYEMSQQIRKRVPPGASVLSIEPRIMTFLSGRNVYDPTEYVGHKNGAVSAAEMKKLRQISRLVFVVHGWRVSRLIEQMIHQGKIILVGRRPLVRIRPMLLSRMHLEGSPPPHRRAGTTQPAAAAQGRVEGAEVGKIIFDTGIPEA
jgi:hypothetical protein